MESRNSLLLDDFLGKNTMYKLKPIAVKNRLGEIMDVLMHSFITSAGHVYLLVTIPKKMHASAFTKNAEYIAHQLRQHWNSYANGFSVIEIRNEKDSLEGIDEVWYGWKFNWVGNTPMDSQCYELTAQKKSYIENLLEQSEAA